MKKVVGYIRVSTPRQAEEGISLDEQAHMLRGYCDDKKLSLLTIEEDDCSAAGAQGHLLRHGLRQVINIAKEKNVAILVPSVDRLARHPGVLNEIRDAGLSIISVADRRRLGKKAFEQLIGRAQRERDLISQRARAGAARAKAKGVKLGNGTNLDVAQRKGAISNSVRADRKAQELADFIEHTPGWEQMTFKERVELLNRSGTHNLISEKRNERRPWTMSSIRKPLKRAEAELDLRKELADEEINFAPSLPHATSLDRNADVAVGVEELAAQTDDVLPASISNSDRPGFGDF